MMRLQVQMEAASKGYSQVLWLFGPDKEVSVSSDIRPPGDAILTGPSLRVIIRNHIVPDSDRVRS